MPGLYKIKTVAQRTGFSATLLRAWEKRYNFLCPQRQASGHRLYTQSDLSVLIAVKARLDLGHSIGEIAAMGREALLSSATPQESRPQEQEFKSLSEAATKWRTELLEALSSLNAAAARDILREVFQQSDCLELQLFLQEMGREVGQRWSQGLFSVAQEHLMTSLCRQEIQRLILQGCERDANLGRVVCAGFPDERHELGLLQLQLELQRTKFDVVNLGPALPFEDLDETLRTLQPSAVCLTVARRATYRVHQASFLELLRRHPLVRFVVGGMGIIGEETSLRSSGAVPWCRSRSLSEIGELLKP